jgi:acyltransferase
MVIGHTLDALLAPSVRAEPLVQLYWMARGFTAPLFMLVAGWAVTAAVSRAGDRGLAIPLGRLPRVLLLLFLGYGLRWPGWGITFLEQGDHTVWAHFLAFDALHAIAGAMLATIVVLGLGSSRRQTAALLALLAVGSVALGLAPLAAPATMPAPSLPLLALAQAIGGTSAFPLFPWVGYFFVGALVGTLAGSGDGRRALAMAGVGALLVAGALWNGAAMGSADPRLFAFRTGVVLVFLATLSLVPASLATRLRPIGRASLAVYVIHLPIVYGWSTHQGLFQRVGPQLPLGAALAAGAAVLAASFALRFALVRAAAGARAVATWLAPRLPLMAGSRGLIPPSA